MNEHVSLTRKVALRLSIIVFYVGLFAFLFYLPMLKNFLFTDKKTLNVFTFSEFFTADSIRQFEAKYNVNVNVNYYDSNEELFAKFKITGGNGYDIVIPSDYMIEKLRKENLLATIDHAKLPIINEIDEKLLGQYFDVENQYSMPIHWVTYGILYNKSIFTAAFNEMSLKYLFEEPKIDKYIAQPYKIAMFDDAIEAVFLSSLYKYGTLDVFDDARLESIQDALIDQKKMVASYLGHDIRNFLFTDLFQLAITSSMNARRLLQETDAFDFKIPKEGCLYVIENIAIPAASKNKDMSYLFINFMLSEKIAKQRADYFGGNPSNKSAYKYISNKFLENKNFFPDKETFSRLHLTHNRLPLKKFEQIWLKVKSK